jgi:hypothetical protein
MDDTAARFTPSDSLLDLEEILEDLHASKIDGSISWDGFGFDGIAAKIGDMKRGVVSDENFSTFAEVKQWLCNEACNYYRMSGFTLKYGPPDPRFGSEYPPGSPKAIACGCTCPPDQAEGDTGFYRVRSACPAHGFK